MIKLVLHQAGQPPKFRDEFPEKPDLVHGAEDGRDVAPVIEYFQKSFAHMRIAQKGVVHQRQLIANELGQIRMELEPALLDMQKNSHEPLRAVSKYC